MKITKKALKEFVRSQLAVNPTWALKGLVRIYTENQTDTERSCQGTMVDNGIGFTGVDGTILSSFAEQYEKRKSLSPKQMALVFKKMPKYWSQIIQMADEQQLKKAYLKSKGYHV